MNWKEVPMPSAIAALEQDPRGYPIFYVIQPPEGRQLNFKAVNPANQYLCGKQHRCAICGQRLSYRFVFLGSVQDLKERMFGEGPMHRECLDYARQVCPFLLDRHEPKHMEPADPLLRRSEVTIAAHLEIQVLYETRGIKAYGDYHGTIMFMPEAPTKVEFFDRAGHEIPEPVEIEVPA